MMLNETINVIRDGHLMVRSAEEWDQLSAALVLAYDAKDDELIEQLRSPFLQSWRAVTTNVLRDAFDTAGITVSAPEHPWGIATLLAGNGSSCEPLLCEAEDTVDGRLEAAVYGGLRLQNFEETMTAYATCISRLLGGDLQRELIYKPAKSRPRTHAAYLRTQEWGETPGDEDLSL